MAEGQKVLVTGANGCIGAWALKGAVDRGWRPVATDLVPAPTRPRLLLNDDALAEIPWHAVDLADSAAVDALFAAHRFDAVIHLGALQVPFCKADPIVGAQVNVVGTVNILEAVRNAGIRRLSFASSIAVYGTPEADNPYLGTLYGAYKQCTETAAQVYWQDWQVPSVIIRPGVVYGVGRDQGMTSAPTKALVAAAAGRPYVIPFTGDVGWLYVGEVAGAFLQGVAEDGNGAHVFDLNGRCHAMTEFLDLVSRHFPNADIAAEGTPLPFPPDLSDQPIRDHLGDYGVTILEAGVAQAAAMFKDLLPRGLIDLNQLTR